jgi:hypothetical protein
VKRVLITDLDLVHWLFMAYALYRYQLDGDRNMLNNIKSELAALRVFQLRHEASSDERLPDKPTSNGNGNSRSSMPSDETKWSPPRNNFPFDTSFAAEPSSFASIPPPPPPMLPVESVAISEDKLQRLPPHVREETEALLRMGYSENDTLIQTILSIHQ